MIHLDGISKNYVNAAGMVRDVLKNVSLTLNSGETIAIVGPSGSGKSTLLNIMGGLDKPSKGKVMFLGQDLSSMGEKQSAAIRNKSVGFVFQDHHLLPQLNLMENVLLPGMAEGGSKISGALTERAKLLLAEVELSGKEKQYPAELSGGECQRAALVRALINQPEVLLADEPTGSLDQRSAENLGNMLIEVNQKHKVAMVIVTHALSLARKMDTVYEIQDGQLQLMK